MAASAVLRQNLPCCRITHGLSAWRSLAAQPGVIGRKVLYVGVAERLRERRHRHVLLVAGLVRLKYPGKVSGVLSGKIRPGIVGADTLGAVTARTALGALLACRRVPGHLDEGGR